MCFTVALFAQQKLANGVPPAAKTDSQARLPVKRVVLYKNGVGYFEHAARVRGNQDLAIDFTTSQLNDVLKSLTVVDLGEGKISSVRYNSIAPVDERLKTLRIPVAGQTSTADFLASLRGAHVEVRSGATRIVGRLLTVESLQRPAAKDLLYTVSQISVVADDGEVRTFELAPGTGVRVLDGELKEEISKYLNLIGSARDRDVRRMTLSTTGTGERPIFVSYISEVPIWKSTYRIVLPSDPGKKPLLQGWAIVDNTTGEDWKDVQLALVAGAPQSFIQQLSQPYYARRPVVELPKSVMLTPQQHEAALGGVGTGTGGAVGSGSGPGVGPGSGGGIGGGAYRVGGGVAGTGLHGTVTDTTGAVIPGAKVTLRNEQLGTTQSTYSDSSGAFTFSNAQSGNSALFVEKMGFKQEVLTNFYLGVGRTNEIHITLEPGAVAETVMVTAAAPTVSTTSSAVAAERKLEDLEAEASAGAAGDLFEYDLKQKITIGKNQSALVPIVQAHIDAEKVTVWSPDGSDEKPRRALWITNSSGLTLDSGTFHIQEAETFAGEGTIEIIHSGERRLLSYAADDSIRIKSAEEEEARPVTRVRVVKGVMMTTREQRDKMTYVVHNADTTARSVIIEHPARDQWKLVAGAKPEESSASYHRFRVNVGPGKTERLVVEEFHPEEARYELTNLDDDQLATFIEQKAITPEMEGTFRRVAKQKGLISGIDGDIRARQNEINSIISDQNRLRENMKALKGSSEEKALLQRYTHQLDRQEDRLGELHKQIEELQAKRRSASTELDTMVMEIALDKTF